MELVVVRAHLMPATLTPLLAILRNTLDGVEPEVMRRLIVLTDIRLNRLHLVKQVALGSASSHH